MLSWDDVGSDAWLESGEKSMLSVSAPSTLIARSTSPCFAL